MTEASVDQSIAQSLGADPALLPILDYLMQDVEVMGPDPEQIVGMVRPLKLSGARTVLDLGCGKGTVATALAAELGLHVTGIDAFEPFIEECRVRASALGVGDACLFEAMDMRRLVGRLPRFDVVMLLACGGVFGDSHDTIRALRTFVRPKGFLLIGDCYGAAADGLVGITGHEDAVRAVANSGDDLVSERHGSTQDSQTHRVLAAKVMARRARELMRLYPGLAATMWEFVESFGGGVAGDSLVVTPTVWLVRRGDDDTADDAEPEDAHARTRA